MTARITTRFALPTTLVRGLECVVACPLYLEGALLVPTSGTGTVYDPAGDVVSTDDVVVADGIASLTVPDTDLPDTLVLGTRYRIEFSLVTSEGTHRARNAAYLCRSELNPVLTDQDLYAVQTRLDPSHKSCIHDQANFVGKREEAWVTILSTLIGRGSLPHLVAEPSSLRELHRLLTLGLIFDDFATSNSAEYAETAKGYHDRYAALWLSLTFEYDYDDNGTSDGRKAASSTTFLGSPPRWR